MRAFYHTALRAAFVALAVLPSLSAASAGPRRTLQENLVAGKPMVLVVSPAPTRAALRSEAYADWSAYLNDFAHEHRGEFQFVRIRPAELKAVFAESTPLKRPFAVVFVKDAAAAVYSDSPVVEPVVYRVAADFLAGRRDIAAAGANGLKPFRFRLRGGR